MFKLLTLPAENGDCLWIEYGEPNKPNRILIDTGTKEAYPHLRKKLLELEKNKRVFELMIMTHFDNDHILGALDLFDDNELGVKYGDIWFNGWPHISEKPIDMLGPEEAEIFSYYLHKKGYSWNAKFSNKAVAIEKNRPIDVTLPGGMKLTLLSPIFSDFVKLEKDWEDRLAEKGLEPGFGMEDELPADVLGEESPSIDEVNEWAEEKFTQEHTPSNQCSIAVLAEYQGKRCLLAGDASPEIILSSLTKYAPKSDRFHIDLFKISHHGSKYNQSNNLLAKIDCPKYVITTNGKQFRHPHKEGISKIIAYGGKKPISLFFNYRTKYNKFWDDGSLKGEFNYEAVYGRDGFQEITI
jgi:hypothetical protein